MVIKKSKLYHVCNVICFLSVIAVTCFLIVYWNQIPDQIPGHYNVVGEIDKMTGKSSLFFLLGVEWILISGITVLEHFPSIWNTGVTITADNKERVYHILSNMIVTMKMMLAIFISYLIIHTMTLEDLPFWYLIIFLCCIFCPMIISLILLYRAK